MVSQNAQVLPLSTIVVDPLIRQIKNGMMLKGLDSLPTSALSSLILFFSCLFFYVVSVITPPTLYSSSVPQSSSFIFTLVFQIYTQSLHSPSSHLLARCTRGFHSPSFNLQLSSLIFTLKDASFFLPSPPFILLRLPVSVLYIHSPPSVLAMFDVVTSVVIR